MLKQIMFENWKSFGAATLDIDPLTILIGTNASGKSNALDGILLLNRTALGKDLQEALAGDPTLAPIRGGIEWAAHHPGDRFTIQALLQGEEERTDYRYSITIETAPRVQLAMESLYRVCYHVNTGRETSRTQLFFTDIASSDSPSIIGRLYNENRGTKKEFRRATSILSQLTGLTLRKEITDGIETVARTLQNIFILDPVPSNMRTYSALTEHLQTDAANIAGVLAALPVNQRKQVEATLSAYTTQLPERDIRRVWAEPVGKFGQDAMLYCEEAWTSDQSATTIDARGMSDGTLRFLAILTALLTRPNGSQLIIEEVDNGLHPSRTKLLLQMLKTIGQERQIDILVTTHNAALLDELGPEMVPFVVVAHRDPRTGDSELTLLEDLHSLPKLLAGGPLGQIVTKGSLERALTRAELGAA